MNLPSRITDGRKAITASLFLVVLITVSGAAWSGESRQPRELAWLKNTEARINALILRPQECAERSTKSLYHLGRLAFNSPRLLGGQAGRMGLSCASCHPSARANDVFFVQQISSQPGYADISNHFLSSAGGDQKFNPIKIPDLAKPSTLKFPNRQSPEFDELLTQLIEIEFDGQPPTNRVFRSLKAYLAQQNVIHCDAANQLVRRDLQYDWSLIDDGLASFKHSISDGDQKTIEFISASMRAVLETIYRFFPTAESQDLDARLLSVSRRIQAFPSVASLESLEKLRHELNDLERDLLEFEDRSLYEPAVAQKFLEKL